MNFKRRTLLKAMAAAPVAALAPTALSKSDVNNSTVGAPLGTNITSDARIVTYHGSRVTHLPEVGDLWINDKNEMWRYNGKRWVK